MVNSTANSKVQVELRAFRDCQGIFRIVARKDSVPGVGFSNFETNYLFFSSISRTKRLRV